MTLRAASIWLMVALAADARADLRSAVQDCRNRLDGQPVGLPAIEQRCPDLPAALQTAGIRPLIIDSSRALITRDSLEQLPGLIRPAGAPAPPIAALEPVLRALRPAPAPASSWWQRLFDWLSARLAHAHASDRGPWLTGLLRRLPHGRWLWRAIMWTTLIVLPVAVAAIVRREARAMGRRSRDAPLRSAAPAGAAAVQSRLARLRLTPLSQRPAQLFALLISRLVAAGRLPPDRSLTHREIARRAVLEDPEQRRLIDSLARLSERQLYSVTPGSPEGLEELLAQGEDLYTVGWGQRGGE